MKNTRHLMWLAAATLTLNACQTEKISPIQGEVSHTFSTAIPSGLMTYAASAPFSHNGGAANLDPDMYDLRYILEVWTDEQEPRLAYREVKTTNDFSGPMSFDVRLIAMKYNFVFWADFVDNGSEEDKIYDTDSESGLRNITVISDRMGGNDCADAYYAVQSVDLSQGSGRTDVTLKRPFGKIRLVATDQLSAGVSITDRPSSSTIDYGSVEIPSGFDALAKEAKGSMPAGKINVADIRQEDALVGGQTYYGAYIIGYDYIFASEAKNGYSFDVTIYNESAQEIGHRKLSSIPVDENRLTTVIGNFFTNSGSVSVVVEDSFDGTENEIGAPVNATVSSIAEANALLASFSGTMAPDQITVTIDGNTARSNTLEIPGIGSMIEIILKNITIPAMNVEGSSFTGSISIVNETGSQDGTLDINLPKASAQLEGGDYASVSSNVLTSITVAGDTRIDVLDVNSGNVEIIGSSADVSTIDVTGNNADEIIVKTVDGANMPEVTGDSGNKVVNVDTNTGEGAIYNKNKGESYSSVRDAVIAAEPGDVISIAEGKYDLGQPGQPDKSGPNGYYLKIDKSMTLSGKGNVEIYTSHQASSGNWSLQNLVTVTAPDVTIENITLVANYNGYYNGPNKTVEVFSDKGNNFTIRNCRLIDSGSNKNGGCLYIGSDGANTQKATVENCTFVNSAITVRPNTTAAIKGCTFNGIRQTAGWNTSLSVRGKAEATDCVFTGEIPAEYNANVVTAPGNGIINLKGCTFPTEDTRYWTASNFGAIFVDYSSAVSQEWAKDRTEPMSFAISGDIIELETVTSPDNNWYAWQGRKAKVSNGIKGTWTVETELTVPETTRPVRQSVWLNINNDKGSSADWAIVGYKVENDGETGFFETWNSKTASWDKVELSEVNVNPGDKARIKFTFDNGTVTEYINGTQVNSYSIDNVTLSELKEIIFNSYSYGESYKTVWSYPTVR